MAKEIVEVNGKSVRMGEAAFKIASKHFGASKRRTVTKEVPIELKKAPPKLPITPAIKEPVKAEVNLEAKEVNVTAIPEEIIQKKVTRRKTSK